MTKHPKESIQKTLKGEMAEARIEKAGKYIALRERTWDIINSLSEGEREKKFRCEERIRALNIQIETLLGGNND